MKQWPQLLANPLAIGLAILLNLCRSGGKEWSQWSGLNRRPTVYETVALPLSYIGFQFTTSQPKHELTDLIARHLRDASGSVYRTNSSKPTQAFMARYV